MKKLFSLALMIMLFVVSAQAQFDDGDTTSYEVDFIVKKSKGKYSIKQNVIDENGAKISIEPVQMDSVNMAKYLEYNIQMKQNSIDSLTKKVMEIEDEKAYIRKYMDRLIDNQKRYRQLLWIDEKAIKKLKNIKL